MNAPQLLETLTSRGAVVSFDGGTLWVKPRDVLTPALRDEVRRLKPELVSLLQHGNVFAQGAVAASVADASPDEHAQSIEEARERLTRLESARGMAGACRSIWRASRRLECERPGLWRRLNASDRHALAVCVALLDAGEVPEP